MALHDILKRSQKFATDNSPAILTALAVTGTLTTAYLTGKASIRAVDILEQEKFRYEQSGQKETAFGRPFKNGETLLTKKETVQLLWKLYIPPAIAATFTCAAIVGVNRIGTRRTAAMAAAFTLSERAFDEYKSKVVEKIGETKEKTVRDEVAQDRVIKHPPRDGQIIMSGEGDVLFMDAYSGRYFLSTMETVKKAQNDINYIVLNDGYASLSDLYGHLELPNTKVSDDLGWNSDKLLEMTFSTTMTEDQRPCIVMDFVVAPVRNYFRTH